MKSVAGLQVTGSSIPYAASKAAINCMTMSLARHFWSACACKRGRAGPITTRWLAGRQEMIDDYVQQTPLGRASSREDVAEAVEFLALARAC